MRPPTARAVRSTENAERTALYYYIDNGSIFLKKGNGATTRLTNFVARITNDIEEDDGAEARRLVEITAAFERRSCTFTVPAAQFNGLSWVTEKIGAGAMVCPGQTLRDHARAAIITLSDKIPRRQVVAHTGWRRFGDEWCFVHAAGAIGAHGLVADVETALSGSLARVRLSAPPQGEEAVAALRASLALFDLAPRPVMAAVLGATYLAPLCEALGTERPDFTVWLHGPTQQQKSELAALAQAHYGVDFSRVNLPTTFLATSNALERLLFAAKDVLLVVDDYHPAADPREAARMAENAQRLLRGVGNGAGRPRMRADTTLRPDLPPRAMALATGERLPSGQSTNARMFAVPVTPGAVNLRELTAAQARRPLLSAAMAVYVQHIAKRMPALQASLPERFTTLRTKAQGRGARWAAQVAYLMLGLETFCDLAQQMGVLSRDARQTLLGECWDALVRLGAEQAEEAAIEGPVERFTRLLASGFASRRVYVEAKDGGAPQDAATWGWERLGDIGAQPQHGITARPVGWLDSDWLLLNPEAVFEYVVSAARTAGELFPVDKRTLLRRLDEAGLIEVVQEKQQTRREVRVRVGGANRRVIKLRARAVLFPDDRGQGTPQGTGEP